MASPDIDYCQIPAQMIPGIEANLVNPPTLAPVSISVGVMFTTIATVLTVGRTFANRKRMHLADWFTIAACILNIAFTGVILAQSPFNRHSSDIPMCWVIEYAGTYFQIGFINVLISAPVFFTSKAAILLLLRQAFGVERAVRRAVDIGLVVTLLLYLPHIPLTVIFDAPRSGEKWSDIGSSERPPQMGPWGILQSGGSVLLDIFVFLLPMPILAKLRVPFGQRIQLVGVFATALMGVTASIMSLIYRVYLLETTDHAWYQAIVCICAMVENNVAIIVGCMPAFAQLIRTTFCPSTRKPFRSSPISKRGSPMSGRGNIESEFRGSHPATIGSTPVSPRRRDYIELEDDIKAPSVDSASTGCGRELEGKSVACFHVSGQDGPGDPVDLEIEKPSAETAREMSRSTRENADQQ